MGAWLRAVRGTVVLAGVTVGPSIHHCWGGWHSAGWVGLIQGRATADGGGQVRGVGLQGCWGNGNAVSLLSILSYCVLYIFGHRIVEKMFVWKLCLQSLDVAPMAEQVIIQRIATLVSFVRQLNPTVLLTEKNRFKSYLSCFGQSKSTLFSLQSATVILYTKTVKVQCACYYHQMHVASTLS